MKKDRNNQKNEPEEVGGKKKRNAKQGNSSRMQKGDPKEKARGKTSGRK